MEKAALVSGVYRVYDPSGKSPACFVGFSFNIAGAIKRLRFELALNACANKRLQALWHQCGELAFETLEEVALVSDVTFEGQAALETLAHKWRERLGEHARMIQSEVTL